MNPIRLAEAPSVPHNKTLENALDGSSSSGSLPFESRKHVSIACEGCKQRRRKCSQNQPCDSCVRQNVECVFAEGHDGRRKEARKRKVQDLQGDSDLLKELLETLGGSETEDSNQLLALIRRSAPKEEIKEFVRQNTHHVRLAKRRRSPALELLADAIGEREQGATADAYSRPSAKSRVLDIAHLTDEPLFKVCALPWTTVTDDDILVSNLISLWITWDRQFYHWIDLDLFLRDMQQGQLECKYCSPFLVNILLACACPLSDYSEARTKRGAPSELMSEFLEAAKGLLEESKGEPSITTAQGLAIMFQATTGMGQGAGAFEYLQAVVSMCQDLEIKFPHIKESDHATPEDRRFSRALDTTCWGLFNYVVMAMLVYQKAPGILPPSRPMPLSSRDSYEWLSYPTPEPARPCYSQELLHRCSFLSTIVRDIAQLLWGERQGESQMLEANVLQLHARLLQWHSSLPDHLHPHDYSPPSVLLCLCYYQSIVMTILTPLRQNNANSLADTSKQASQDVKSAAIEIVRMCRLWSSSFGVSHTNVFLIQPIYLALYALINEDDSYDHADDIFDLCFLFRAMTRRWPFAMAAFRMFQITAQKLGKLSPAAETLFQDFQDHDWREKDWQGNDSEQVNGIYAASGVNKQDDYEIYDMHDFFAAMENTNLDDPPQKGKGKGAAA